MGFLSRSIKVSGSLRHGPSHLFRATSYLRLCVKVVFFSPTHSSIIRERVPFAFEDLGSRFEEAHLMYRETFNSILNGQKSFVEIVDSPFYQKKCASLCRCQKQITVLKAY